ncbi:diguanylate cyclase (GGDEF)-like protein [Pseudomonas plecoglossicida]
MLACHRRDKTGRGKYAHCRKYQDRHELAERDALTQVASRYRLEQALLKACEYAQRFRQPLALIAMDVDDLKPINDRFGHVRGDAALIRVAEVLRGGLREQALLARWGGDKFVMMLPQTPLVDALEVAAQMRRALARVEPVEQHPLTLSYGVVVRQDGETQHELLARAGKAMYRAKGAGKDTISE